MTREQRFPNTSTFHFYNANPKGKFVDDCVVRAIATATGKTWDDVFCDLCELAKKYKGMPNDKKVYGKYLKMLGWVKHPQPRRDNGLKFTGCEFCKELAESGKRYIAHIGGRHIVAIVDGKVNDIWNSTAGCIGNYWTKEGR